ncbi:MAG: LacI family DNA-binding transcriptional regulator [Luteolibacter sp.]|uniref:LacI family DNA-binding transcriptional regulator n=1 Tax=Luteolibacter sp. TaxID=1962973 RepID=UPI0032645F9B
MSKPDHPTPQRTEESASPEPRVTPKAVTLKDVAREVGVTIAAVSLALKNHASISEARREEIHATAARLGYRPNAMATALAHHREQSRFHPVQAALAFINTYPDPAGLHAQPAFEDWWRGATVAAEKFGYRPEEFSVNAKQPLKRLERIFLTRNIRGIIIGPLPPGESCVNWEAFAWNQFSVVRCGFREQSPPFHFVTSAQATNTMLAFDKIRERGYQRIGFAGYWDKARMFGAGFHWSQDELSLEARVPPFLFSKETPEQDQQPRFEEWLKKAKPDAILTDSLAVPTMLDEAGYRVPEDIGLAATNVRDMPVDAGIDQNPEEIGRVSALAVISLIHDNDFGKPKFTRQILVQGEWVDGKSLPVR